MKRIKVKNSEKKLEEIVQMYNDMISLIVEYHPEVQLDIFDNSYSFRMPSKAFKRDFLVNLKTFYPESEISYIP